MFILFGDGLFYSFLYEGIIHGKELYGDALDHDMLFLRLIAFRFKGAIKRTQINNFFWPLFSRKENKDIDVEGKSRLSIKKQCCCAANSVVFNDAFLFQTINDLKSLFHDSVSIRARGTRAGPV